MLIPPRRDAILIGGRRTRRGIENRRPIQFHTELVSDIWVELLFMHRCSESPAGGVAHVGAKPAFRVPIGRCYTASERLG